MSDYPLLISNLYGRSAIFIKFSFLHIIKQLNFIFTVLGSTTISRIFMHQTSKFVYMYVFGLVSGPWFYGPRFTAYFRYLLSSVRGPYLMDLSIFMVYPRYLLLYVLGLCSNEGRTWIRMYLGGVSTCIVCVKYKSYRE